MLVGTQHPFSQIELRVREEIKLLLVRLHALQDRLRAQSLVREQRQGGNCQTLPLCLARPVQKWRGDALEFLRSGARIFNGFSGANFLDQPFRILAIGIDVPGKLRIERPIVTILRRLFLLLELRLNSDVRPQNSFCLLVVVSLGCFGLFWIPSAAHHAREIKLSFARLQSWSCCQRTEKGPRLNSELQKASALEDNDCMSAREPL